MGLTYDISGNAPSPVSTRSTVAFSNAVAGTYVLAVVPPGNKFQIDFIFASATGSSPTTVQSGTNPLLVMNLINGIPFAPGHRPGKPFLSGNIGENLVLVTTAAQQTNVTIGYRIV